MLSYILSFALFYAYIIWCTALGFIISSELFPDMKKESRGYLLLGWICIHTGAYGSNSFFNIVIMLAEAMITFFVCVVYKTITQRPDVRRKLIFPENICN